VQLSPISDSNGIAASPEPHESDRGLVDPLPGSTVLNALSAGAGSLGRSSASPAASDPVADPAGPAQKTTAAASQGNAAAIAWEDWWAGTRNVPLWWTLARYDILLRYRRSILGPLWLTISMGILLLGMGPLYATLFGISRTTFFPHLTLGIIFWHFFTASIQDGCNVFLAAGSFLKQANLPGSVFIWRSLARNTIQLGHQLVLYVPVAVWAGVQPSPRMLLFIPGFLVVLVNLHALSITLGIICVRFRDVKQIVTSCLQMLMFLTPVFWFPDRLPRRSRFILYNPMAQLLDVLRLPLLGSHPAPGTVWFMLFFTILNLAIAATLYVYKRRQVVYWL
jgi:lipopolysaccharide transport system permease protein